MTLENLLVLLLFLLFLLPQVIGPWLRRRRGGAGSEVPEDEAPGLSRVELPQEVPPLPVAAPQGSAVSRGPQRAGAPPAHAVSPPFGPRSVRSQLGDIREVRRGIVLMTVLGPCRAHQESGPSPGQRDDAPARSLG